ncbi:ankyrin repeat domain-containing protein [Amycolatopsis nigrescens]|uniref:ankyrin repeat domain-containing protein n=1 Tax=Amycolatopsis nigrescens TaxID=381445 RepID=UPI00036D256C|nr:ankyrin repeat domain-containing protein [Amycolatopsis nigrescens]
MSSSLPATASMERLRKLAKDLQRAHRAGDTDALSRVAARHPEPSDPLKLTEAQFVLAREHGFPSWPRLQAYVRRVEECGPELEHAYHADLAYYAERAAGLLVSAQDETPEAVAAFEKWRQPRTRPGARAVVARRHGFENWRELKKHVGSLAESGEPFARAYQAVEAQDVEGLAALLGRFPELVKARGTNGNDLLGMATATHDERLVRVLLEHGADPSRANAHGSTPLHQSGYVGLPHLAKLLLDAGARVDGSARGDGGTPLVMALFWGHRETADLLAGHGLAPRNLRVAAGLGWRDLLDELIGPDGTLAPEAGAHRGFYRPHSGFGAWQPSDDPAEIRNEALSWAARNGRLEALDLLVARGADLEADVYQGTALAWAAFGGRADAVERLLALGADVNGRGSFGGPEHGEGSTALHLAAQSGWLDVLGVLLAAGADRTIRDALYDATPAEWAEHCGQPEAERLLRS